MILTVTLNCAVDLTYHLDALAVHATNRVLDVRQRAGGKGINVARVLRALGHDPVVTGLAGGRTGEHIRADLRYAGLRDELVTIGEDSRRTVTVVDRCDATVLNEPGPAVTGEEWNLFLARFRVLVHGADVVVLAGSVPRGVPAGAYVELAGAAGSIPVVLDCAGSLLLAGLGARPTLIKPNVAELREMAAACGIASATSTGDTSWIIETATALRGRGAGAVVVSCGGAGLVAVTPDGTWRVAAPQIRTGNPAGAGDAAVAALAAGVAAGSSWPDRLVDAVALSAAAVLSPVAGSFDPDAYDRFRNTASAEPL